ncbi:CTD kinase subunit gamma [Wickerhamiella sorbophila]|uniref:CTD kinase subunit gamma n=1 Tax=Wickerhamiella sorbophila TaxID=45607 RepID=A0A2T0FKY6_9ASCO|nr:CTD kinase subunit gamma [Wickerhamiella sorbophila]PRT55648.1 CTD kinase subunit gamma [Wickerhamiella sorbophila]
MDSFEATLEFAKILRKLNASTKSQDAAIQFLMKNRDLMEDLYRCILYEMSKGTISLRVSILFFLSYLAGVSVSKSLPFHGWIARDIPQIVDLAVPRVRAGLANVAPTEKVLRDLVAKKVVEERHLVRAHEHLVERAMHIQSTPGLVDPNVPETNNDEILRRMEEDRERGKKVKEGQWSVNSASEEFLAAWDNIGGLTELDFEQMDEDSEICADSRQGVRAP